MLIRMVIPLTVFSLCTLGHLSAQESRPAAPKLSPKWRDELAEPLAPAKQGIGAIYGSLPKLKKAIDLGVLVASPEKYATQPVRLQGTITGICAKKGCWMTVQIGERSLMVKFQDYAFFMPRHLTGHAVEFEGLVTSDLVTEAERRHYAEDAGKSPEEISKIIGDETQLRMMSTSVTIREPELRAGAQRVAFGNLDTAAGLAGRKRLRGRVTAAPKKGSSVVLLDIKGTTVSVKLPFGDLTRFARVLVPGSHGEVVGAQGDGPLRVEAAVFETASGNRL